MTLAVRLIAFSRAGPGGPSVPPGVGVARDHEHRRWVLSNHPHHRFGQRLQLRNLIGRDLPRSGCEVEVLISTLRTRARSSTLSRISSRE
jgi:hypothetical protein